METDLPTGPMMSDYERRAWDASIERLKSHERRRQLVPARAREVGQRAGTRALETWERIPGSESVGSMMQTALSGLQSVVFEPALNSVDTNKVVAAYQARHPQVHTLGDFRLLDLKDCDEALPKVRTGYTAASAIQGGATSLAVTGAVISTTVTAGTSAGVAVGAVAADIAATMASMGRVIAIVASRFGYDVREPEEEIFAMGVMSLASATTPSGKTAALASLSRLTQQMMRQATWAQLQQHQLVKVIQRIYLALGFKLTKGKLAQTVPVAGVLLNAGLSAGLTNKTFRGATAVYRLRFLSEKYDLDPMAWTSGSDKPVGSPQAEQVVLVDEIVAGIIDAEADDGQDLPISGTLG